MVIVVSRSPLQRQRWTAWNSVRQHLEPLNAVQCTQLLAAYVPAVLEMSGTARQRSAAIASGNKPPSAAASSASCAAAASVYGLARVHGLCGGSAATLRLMARLIHRHTALHHASPSSAPSDPLQPLLRALRVQPPPPLLAHLLRRDTSHTQIQTLRLLYYAWQQLTATPAFAHSAAELAAAHSSGLIAQHIFPFLFLFAGQ